MHSYVKGNCSTKPAGAGNRISAAPCCNAKRLLRHHRPRLSVLRHFSIEGHGDGAFHVRMDEMRRMFTFWDVDGSGRIDREELERMLALGVVTTSHSQGKHAEGLKLSQHWYTPAEVDTVMRQYDHDNSGDMDFNEFRSFVYDGMLLESQLQEYQQVFQLVDVDGDGCINYNQLLELFTTLEQGRVGSGGRHVPPELLSCRWSSLGREQIDFDEFLEAFRDHLHELKQALAYAGAKSVPAEELHELIKSHVGGTSIVMNEQELDAVLNTHQAQVTVLFACVTWSRLDEAMQEQYQALAERHPEVTFLRLYGNLNAETKRLFKHRLRARTTPTFFVFRGTACVKALVGADVGELEAEVEEQKAVMKQQQQLVGR